MKKIILKTLFLFFTFFVSMYTFVYADTVESDTSEKDDSLMYENTDFVEKEQPELDDETKQLILLYQKNPTEENYLNLRANVIKNYNAVLAKKENKLSELQQETLGKPGGEDVANEMWEIVQEMYVTYWSRINSNMLRFTDTRLLSWNVSEAAQYEYIPVMGAGESIYIKRTPVTNEEYAEYIAATGKTAPSNWVNGKCADGEEDYPVNFVSYEDALLYCKWLTDTDTVNTYRLPNESEWELAAGHMPKDADFNCSINDGRTSVYEYSSVTRGAHGAVDFWGNVWEWTSTVRDEYDGTTLLGVKGGSWKSDRTVCRTEYRKEGRDSSQCYDDVGFRVIQVLNGKEPEVKVELATLDAPDVSIVPTSSSEIKLSWNEVEGAMQYQIFEYESETDHVSMLDLTTQNSVVIDNLEPNTTYNYIVQPISYVKICDNVSGKYAVSATTFEETYVLADVNFDGKITATDAQLALAASKTTAVLSDNAKKAADANQNGTIEAADAVLILKYVRNNDFKLPM